MTLERRLASFGAAAAVLLAAGCWSSERVVVTIELVPDGGQPPEPQASPQPQPQPQAGMSATPVPPMTRLDASVPSEPPRVDARCAQLLRSWTLLDHAVHDNDCQIDIVRASMEQWTLEEIFQTADQIREALMTPIDASLAVETSMPTICDLGIPGYTDRPVLATVFILCPATCKAAEDWLEQRGPEVSDCRGNGP